MEQERATAKKRVRVADTNALSQLLQAKGVEPLETGKRKRTVGPKLRRNVCHQGVQQLTQLARQMVGRWGMSPEVGPVAVLPADGRGPLLPGVAETSRAHALARRSRGAPHRRGRARRGPRAPTAQRDKLEALARELLEHETLEEAEAYEAAGVERPPDTAEEEPQRMPAAI